MQVWHVSRTQCGPKHGVGDAVELDEDHPRDIGDGRPLGPLPSLAGHPLVDPTHASSSANIELDRPS